MMTSSKSSIQEDPNSTTFTGFEVLFYQPKLYFFLKLIFFLIIILERLYMILENDPEHHVAYFIPLIAVLLCSLIIEYMGIKRMTRRKIKEIFQFSFILIVQIITFQAIIELSLPMFSDQISQQEIDVLRSDILYLVALTCIFIDASILRLSILVYTLSIFFFRLSDITKSVFYIGWGIMMAILVTSNLFYYFKSHQEKDQSHIPKSLENELNANSHGIMIINKNSQLLFMNYSFKAIMCTPDPNLAYDEVLKLRKFESYSDRAKRNYLEEMKNFKPNSPASVGCDLKIKSAIRPFGRMASLRKSVESDKHSVVTFKESIEMSRAAAPPEHRDSHDRSSYILAPDSVDESHYPQMLNPSPKKRTSGAGKPKIKRKPTRRGDTDHGLIPHEESVEAVIENLLSDLDDMSSLNPAESWEESLKRILFAFRSVEGSAKHYIIQPGAGQQNHQSLLPKMRVISRDRVGQVRLLEVKLLPFKNIYNQGIFITLHDVTAEVKLDEANEISEQKDRLLRFVSHEFRSPINGALSFLGNLSNSISYALNTQYVNPAINSCKLLLSLVNDILDVSMLKEKKFKISIQSCNLRKTFMEAIEIMQMQASIQNIALQLVWDTEIQKTFHTDPTRVKQILLNLISNALKFTQKGSITVKASRVDTGIVCVQVIDTGIGISNEGKEKLFEEFHKVQETFHLNPQGVGLGLVISQLLAQQLDSDEAGLTVESELGQGTTFTFSLMTRPNEAIKKEFVSKTGDVDLSDDEGRERPASLLKQMNKTFGVIEQATKPSRPTISIIHESPIQSEQFSELMQFNPSETKSKLLEFKEKIEKAQKGQVNRLGTVVRSNIVNSTNTLLIDPIKISAFSNEKNILKKNVSRGKFERKPFEVKERAKSIGRSHTLASGEANSNEVNVLLFEFSVLVKTLNTRCECPKALIVDDNAYNLLALTHQLRSLDIDSISAVDGELAIQEVLKNQGHHAKCKNFSIIFMDVEMPRLDGFETTKILRKKMLEGDISFIPIIGVSGHNPKEKRKECLLSGMNDLVIKPVTPAMLIEMVLKWVESL